MHSQNRFVLDRARAFIGRKLQDQIVLDELCLHCGVSLSKLERLFRRALGCTPTSYIREQRLLAVREVLRLTSSADARVAHIAMDFGFNHLGRFADAYRRRFGELPRDTLRTRVRRAV